ncbi:MAG: hypothetical protein AB7G17_09795 [Phycisphaerales bacterium]
MESGRDFDEIGEEGISGEAREPSKAKEVFRAGSGEKKAGEKTSGARDETPMASGGWFGWPFTLAVGVTSLGAAAALAAVHAQERARAGADASILQSVGWVLGWGLVGLVMGFVAVKGVAVWRKRRVGEARLVAVRMFAATGLFLLVVNMGIAPTGWWVVDRPMALGIATAVYLSVVWVTFRLTREDAMAVLITHALLWLGVYGAVRYGPRLMRESEPEPAPQVAPTFEPPHAPASPGVSEPVPTPSQEGSGAPVVDPAPGGTAQ